MGERERVCPVATERAQARGLRRVDDRLPAARCVRQIYIVRITVYFWRTPKGYAYHRLGTAALDDNHSRALKNSFQLFV